MMTTSKLLLEPFVVNREKPKRDLIADAESMKSWTVLFTNEFRVLNHFCSIVRVFHNSRDSFFV